MVTIPTTNTDDKFILFKNNNDKEMRHLKKKDFLGLIILRLFGKFGPDYLSCNNDLFLNDNSMLS